MGNNLLFRLNYVLLNVKNITLAILQYKIIRYATYIIKQTKTSRFTAFAKVFDTLFYVSIKTFQDRGIS